jgi:hypothetical protein
MHPHQTNAKQTPNQRQTNEARPEQHNYQKAKFAGLSEHEVMAEVI